MNKYKLLNELMSYLDEFETLNSSEDLKEFSVFLRDKLFHTGATHQATNIDFRSNEVLDYRQIPEVEFSTLVGTMYRFARHYIKKVLDGKDIKTIDEFGFLATLVEAGKLYKSDLINRHLMEISSGSEILKRLIKKDFIRELPDSSDKRLVMVELTAKGRSVIFDTFSEMHKASLIVKGNLSPSELSDMNYLLNKLKYFHWHIHDTDKSSNIDELITKYITN